MAELAFCFRDKKDYRYLTESEIEEITQAAQGARAIIKVMTHYACDNENDNGADGLSVYLNAFNVLGWLMEPITDFLFNQAGRSAQPEGEERGNA